MTMFEVARQNLPLQETNEEEKPGINLYDNTDKKKTQSALLQEIGMLEMLFHSGEGEDREAYIRARIKDHYEVFRVNSRACKEFLSEKFFDLTNSGCNRNALADALGALTGTAKFRRERRDVFLRVAPYKNNAFVIDLGSIDRSVVEISECGWEVKTHHEVMFLRTKGMLPLPQPRIQGGNIHLLRKYVNGLSENQYCLLISWLAAALHPATSYPILVISGEQNSGKTTLTRMVKRLVDHSIADERKRPKDDTDVFVAALHAWVPAYGNLSRLDQNISDTLCLISTDGTQSKRQLYTDNEESLTRVCRPVILNGISDLLTFPDLARRAVLIELKSRDEFVDDEELMQSFERDVPYIFAGLLDALACALKNREVARSEISKQKLHGLSSFTTWALAASEKLGFTHNQFLTAYEENLKETQLTGLDASIIGEAIQRFMSSKALWTGLANQLLEVLNALAGEKLSRDHYWPKQPNQLSELLKRVVPALRVAGIDCTWGQGRARRVITLVNRALGGNSSSPPSPSSPLFKNNTLERDD